MSDIKTNQMDFSLPKVPRKASAAGRKPAIEGVLRKSSYTIPEELHRGLRLLSAKLEVNINVLIKEAFEDLLAKYGEA